MPVLVPGEVGGVKGGDAGEKRGRSRRKRGEDVPVLVPTAPLPLKHVEGSFAHSG